jgi:hypothetical protein
MKKRGLVVDAVPAGAVAEWRVAAEQFAKGMRGTLIPPDILDLATRERDAFRFRAAKGNP